MPIGVPLNRMNGMNNGKCYLPPAEEASSLLKEYLHECNAKIPLIAPEYIIRHVRDCYTGIADGSPISWVLTYMIFGMAHRLRAMSLFQVPDDTSRANWYLDKCLETLPRLLMQEPSLRLVQALLGVAILLQTSSQYKRATLFVSTAMHMVQDLGYHDTGMPDGHDLEQREQQYVFWVTFLMDTDMSFASVRQCKQSLIEISTSLPDARHSDWWAHGALEEQNDVNVFALHSRFAILQAGILERLFSVQSRQLSDAVLDSAYYDALDRLEQWRRSSFVFNLSACNLHQSLYRSDIVHLVVLETAYFRTVYQLRVAYLMGGFRKHIDSFSVRAMEVMARCDASEGFYKDARRVLELTALVSGANTSITWYDPPALLFW
ncbi:hypothetical protein LTR86_007201 [Recurvomyces mirabilis]|nr:hypothetical protein LTR86_007201 [Recurvomyces mirabilis]